MPTAGVGIRVAVASSVVCVCTLGFALAAQEQLLRVSAPDPRLRIVRVVAAEPVAGAYANGVTADVVVGLDGRVEAVTVIEGQKAHHASAIAALKQYQFAPVLVDGKPSRFVTRLSVHVPDTFANDALIRNSSGSASSTVPGQRDVVLLADCSRALTTRDGSPQAIQTCRDAVAAADASGVASKRSSARSFLGDVYMFAKQWSDAVAAYQAALSVVTPSEAGDLRSGDILTAIAIAQGNLGDFAAADRSATSASAKLQASMTAHPESRGQYASTLRSTLLVHARIKQALGDVEAAKAIERTAAALDGSK